MRRFLLFLGSLGVGLFSVLLIPVMLFSGDFGTSVEALIGWLVVLVFGIALSAPFFVEAPSVIKAWTVKMPLPLAIVLIVVRALSWVGLMILRVVWWLIYKVWDPRPAAAAPAVVPQQVQPGVGYPAYVGAGPAVPQQPVGGVPASWQNDPTGRYMQRYWDGQKWTEHVANGGVMAIDPI